MVCAGEENVTGIRACHSIEQFREYPVPGVSCGSAHGQQVDQVPGLLRAPGTFDTGDQTFVLKILGYDLKGCHVSLSKVSLTC